MFSIRPYQPTDYDACLDIFTSNVPLFFEAEEQATYANFLAQLACPYLIVELADSVVGGGGFYRLPDEGCAGLVWGMVARNYQRRGIGTALLEARLQRLGADSTVQTVRVKTSQRSAPFFERFGFRTERILEHHFAVGLHQYQMSLQFRSLSHATSPNHAMQRTAPRSDA